MIFNSCISNYRTNQTSFGNKAKKLLEKIASGQQKRVTGNKAEQALRAVGFQKVRNNSGHNMFTDDSGRTIAFPYHNGGCELAPPYIKELRELIKNSREYKQMKKK